MGKKRKNRSNKRGKKTSYIGKYIVIFSIIVVLFLGVLAYGIFKYPIIKNGKSEIVYVYPNTTKAKLYEQLVSRHEINNRLLLNICLNSFLESDIMPTGRYKLDKDCSIFTFLRTIRSRMQYPVKLTINNIRTKGQLLNLLSDKLMLSKEDLNKILTNEAYCESIGSDTTNIIGIIMPDTYEFYWDISPGKLINTFKKYYDKFWDEKRLNKAKALGLTPKEITIIASIAEQESNKKGELGKIGRLYINRYRLNMPLQADPTIKFALGDFSIRRITKQHLSVDSPYNTYKNTGLPPGPICIPNKETIDYILNSDSNNYIYMCAKEDFSGYHNFATSYNEHLRNARLYQKELDKRNIK